jgi:tetratricopeptide (TPR) repeat protein
MYHPNAHTDNVELTEGLEAARVELRRAWLQLGYVDIEGARASCARAKALAPAHPLPPSLEGAIELAAGNLKQALAILRAVTRRWPDAPCGHIYYTEACLLMGRFKQAERALKKADEVDIQGQWVEQREDLRALLENLDASSLPAPLELEALGVDA